MNNAARWFLAFLAFVASVASMTAIGFCGPAAGADKLPPSAAPVPDKIEIADGPFQPTWESLKTYQCPDWFRDAKLGIWAICGPQSVPEYGDWYARHMYVEGHRQYQYHVKRFGHPSKFGYKDLAASWKADKFDPDRLMRLYKRAGAKYFVVLANHHDNWDNWNSKYHRWNSVNVGPKKDIVGLWREAARKHGMRFGVTEHLARCYSWFNTNKGSDKRGPLAGVPYDGNDPKYVDLYLPKHADTNMAYPKDPPEWWQRQWFYRIRDLIDTYQPDLVYTDGSVPFGKVGRSLIAHFYNANIRRQKTHGGKLEAVYNLKDWSHRTDHGEYVDGIGVQDVERGVLKGIKAQPWQTDTCIGNWYYKTGIRYKSAKTVVCLLADIVSKNGNMLLNIPLKHDGTIDTDEEKVLAEMAAWIAINGEAIYATRPWKVFGEGPHKAGGGHFGERRFAGMTAADIRFTVRPGSLRSEHSGSKTRQAVKGENLYALAMGRPTSGKIVIRSLAKSEQSPNHITRVRLLGHAADLKWTQDAAALTVVLPTNIKKTCELALALQIQGPDLQPVVQLPGPGPDGRIVLRAVDAEIHGATPKYERGGGKDNIGHWANPKDFVSWSFRIPRGGSYDVQVTYSCAQGVGGSAFTVEVGPHKLTAASKATGAWNIFKSAPLGRIKLDKPGAYSLVVRPKAKPKWKVIGLQSVTLIPAK